MEENIKISVLLCAYESDNFLKEQIDSIFNQSIKNIKIYISDDSRSNISYNIFKFYKSIDSYKDRIFYFEGPKVNFVTNFLSAIKNIDISDYYFFSDQDDVWLKKKVERSINLMKKYDSNKPVLYGSRSTYVDENLTFIGMSEIFKIKPSFKNALLQCYAGGNTMAFNHALLKILKKISITNVPSHDWWLYIVNEFVGGKTIYDENSKILYRQHSKALVGGNLSFFSQLKRLIMLLGGSYKRWLSENSAAILKIKKFGTKENLIFFNEYYNYRNSSYTSRILNLPQFLLNCKRSNLRGNLAIIIAVLFNKF